MTDITTISGDSLESFATAAGERVQLLVFSATWCGPCKAMAPSIDDIADLYADELAVAKIDIEESTELAKEFGVNGVPTLVLRRGDEIVARQFGALTRTRLSSMIDDAISASGTAARV